MAIPQWIKDSKYHFCAVCGRTDDLQYHHWEPESLGGETIPENIIVLCAEHHKQIHNRGGEITHNYLIREGMKKYKENGGRLGRKPRIEECDVLRAIAEKSTQFNDTSLITEREIMSELNLRPTQYSKYKKRLLEAMDADKWPYDWEKPKQVRLTPLYERVIKKKRGDVV